MIRSHSLSLCVGLVCACCPPHAARPPVALAAIAAPAPTAAAVAEPAAPAAADAPPTTQRQPVTDTYQGVAVVDDYRWLEASGTEPVRAWTSAQNAYTRRVLDRLPGRAAIATRVREVLETPAVAYPELVVSGGRWFVLKREPPKQQAFLIVMPAGADPAAAKVVLDPNALDPSGKTTVDFFVPSPDGRRVAVSLSKGGTESGDVQVIDVESGASSDAIARVQSGTAGGDLAWTPDGKGFYYTRYPAPGERPPADLAFYQQLYFHRLGADPSQDSYELGRDLPRIAELRVDVDRHSGRVLASAQNGDGGEVAFYLKPPGGTWRQLTHFEDGVVQLMFGPGGDLFAVSRHDSPRGKVLRVSGKTLDFTRARVLHAPEQGTVVTDFWGRRALLFGEHRWYATFQVGGPSELRAFDYAGKSLPMPAPLEVASVGSLARDGERDLLLRAGSFTAPSAWYRFDERAGTLEKTALQNGAPIDLRQVRVARELATSKDGTQVPLTILLPPGAQADRGSPCVVTGYGGYAASIEPRYSARDGLWLEHGAVFTVANLRGGGEFGDAWHRAGSLEHKQNVFDDFAAVLQHLIDRGYCRVERLGIVGGSNGGLLMGATLVQHPELLHAVVSFVGIYDMLRSERSPNGAFNVTEFGSVTDPLQFRALYAYSPYHHVSDGVAYPRVFMLTGENDPRVDPMQSRKMIARLQASGAGGPFLLRTSENAGHGGGSDLSEIIAQTTDAMSFMLDALRGAP